MKRIILAAPLAMAVASHAQIGTSWTYQGSLKQGVEPATGTYDIRFRLYDAAVGGSQIGSVLCADNLNVIGGQFTVALDFGGQFTGVSRFLEIDVRQDTGLGCGNAAGFVTLGPRQPITPTPYAIHASSAAAASNAAALNGQAAAFYTNASSLSTGTLADARLSSNVTLLSSSQTFTGSKTFATSPAFTAAGAPFTVASSTMVTNLNADLLDGLSSAAFAAASHTHDAGAVISGTLADARLSTNIPRLNAVNNFGAAGSFAGNLGIGTTTPGALLELRAADPQLRVRNSNDTGGGVILNTFGSLQFGLFNPSGAAWGVVPAGGYRAVLAIDNQGRVGSVTNTSAGPAFRNLLDDGSGRLGIGTTSPGAPVDVRFNATQGLQFWLDGGLIPGLSVVGGGGNAGIMRLRNSLEVWPSTDATRAGRVDIRNTAGAPTIAFDGASGNASYNNQPGIAYTQTFRDPRNFAAGVTVTNASQDIDTISINAPATGFLHINATLTLSIVDSTSDASANEAFFKLDDMTSGSAAQLTEVKGRINRDLNPFPVAGGSVLTIAWVVPVNTPGVKSFKTSIFVPSGSATYYTTTLSALYIPRGL
ncbi:MAG: hypothetical protein HBSAPP03_14120 [Phycisphaerae bacterium]|nr:MAG: hypothetical protein HBSAPP03_14120 [Phycisphaerae bacterium]